MDKKALTKKKNDLLKSIMMNPKLAKTFRDAMSAPIGSTKRDQAKAVLSIMKKLSGVEHNGMGGPYPMMGAPMTPPQPMPQSNVSDYSNMMIFPAAPKLKVRTPQAPKTSDGQGGPFDLSSSTPSSGFNFGSPYGQQTYAAPTPRTNPFAGIGKAVGDWGYGVGKGVGEVASAFNPFAPKPDITFGGAISPFGTVANSTPMVAGKYATPGTPAPNFSFSVNTPGAGPTAPLSTLPPPGGTQTGGTPAESTQTGGESMQTGGESTQNGGISTQYRNLSTGTGLKGAAQSAVNEGTGPGLFAMGVANEKFGGSLDQYVANLDEKLKKDFNLEPLETELSNLKAQKNNLVPTLTQYITGKDKYLKFVDSMIDQTEGTLLKQDMGNPAVANSYSNYMNYLYTLKGRQTQRYGNYLNSAISDYNADLEKTQSNYENVYNQYNNAITRQSTIAQNEYNTLYTTMTDLYNNLEQAPTKRANLEALQLQNKENARIAAANALAQNQNVNPKYWADVKLYNDMIVDKDGNMDFTKIPAEGLVGLYYQNVIQGGDEAAMTEAIRRALAKTLETSTDSATAIKVNKLISELASNPDPSGQVFANSLSSSIGPSSSNLISTYVLDKMGDVKNAANDIISGGSGFLWTGLGARKAGITDKASWLKDHSSLDAKFLESLYNTVVNNIQPGSAYEKDPSQFIDEMFAGSTDQEKAYNVAASMTTSS